MTTQKITFGTSRNTNYGYTKYDIIYNSPNVQPVNAVNYGYTSNAPTNTFVTSSNVPANNYDNYGYVAPSTQNYNTVSTNYQAPIVTAPTKVSTVQNVVTANTLQE